MARINKDLIDKWYDYDLSIETRTVYLLGDVDQDSVGRAVKGLHLLASASVEPITLLINTEGGNWQQGMALYDFVSSLPNHVTAKVLGQAMSMGGIILQAADTRIAYANATIMVHDGNDGYDGHPRTFEAWATYGKALRQRMYEIYAECSGKSVSYWSKKCEQDYILTPSQALAEGLIDNIEVPT